MNSLETSQKPAPVGGVQDQSIQMGGPRLIHDCNNETTLYIVLAML